jgi:putative PIN family toxin of toxin-antitoxin system
MPKPQVVFDCMVSVQAAASHGGTSRACFDAAMRREVVLFVSHETLSELRDVLHRDELRKNFSQLTDVVADRFVAEMLGCATLIDPVPPIYSHPLDPKDSPYVNLAIAANADLIVTRDRRHMLSLMDSSRAEGADFIARFPQIRIVAPERLIEMLQQQAD